MKLKLDENLPTALAELLRHAGHDVCTVPEEHLSGADDPPVLTAATGESRVFLTFDTDFADIRKYPPGTHAGEADQVRVPVAGGKAAYIAARTTNTNQSPNTTAGT